MPNIVTAQELSRFLKWKSTTGGELILTNAGTVDGEEVEATDPTLAEVEEILNDVESDFENRVFQAYGHEGVAEEYHEMDYEFQPLKGIPVFLARTHCRYIDTDQGDELKIVVQNVERDAVEQLDYFNLFEGRLWMRYYGIIDAHPRMRIKYRYGIPANEISSEIKLAIKRMAFILIIESNLVTNQVEYSKEGMVSLEATLTKWRDDVADVIARNRVWSYSR